MSGNRWCDHYGTMVITHDQNKNHAVVTFTESSMFKKEKRRDVVGQVGGPPTLITCAHQTTLASPILHHLLRSSHSACCSLDGLLASLARSAVVPLSLPVPITTVFIAPFTRYSLRLSSSVYHTLHTAFTAPFTQCTLCPSHNILSAHRIPNGRRPVTRSIT
jgi:hypothetical protein